jgi:hypothetical protein
VLREGHSLCLSVFLKLKIVYLYFDWIMHLNEWINVNQLSSVS